MRLKLNLFILMKEKCFNEKGIKDEGSMLNYVFFNGMIKYVYIKK